MTDAETSVAPGTQPSPKASETELVKFRGRATEAVKLLEEVVADRARLALLDSATRQALLTAAGQVSRPDPTARRRLAKAFRARDRRERRTADAVLLDSTGLRLGQRAAVFPTPPAMPALPARSSEAPPPPLPHLGELGEARQCYVCKADYREVHHFYGSMCRRCGDLNYAKRLQTADLRGRVALVTGARVKIGYQAALKLLRAGARVIVLTRFPHDAVQRYAREEDYAAFGERLHVYGIDLRHTPSVEALCRHILSTFPRLDFLINNACQTVRRPPGFYAHLLEAEHAPAMAAITTTTATSTTATAGTTASPIATPAAIPSATAASAEGQRALAQLTPVPGVFDAAALSQLELVAGDEDRGVHLFPRGALDQDLQQIDLRAVNSWRLPLAEVSAVELLEVHLVNAVASFVLNARLKPLMLRVPTRDKHIVNVSAMEGQFYRTFKTDKHPHTNMAKAALNMMTRTSAQDYVRDGIHMNSVDTGWVTDEDPAAIAARKAEEQGFFPPLDIVDGAARVLDPILSGINTGEHVWGQFLKDYAPAPW